MPQSVGNCLLFKNTSIWNICSLPISFLFFPYLFNFLYHPIASPNSTYQKHFKEQIWAALWHSGLAPPAAQGVILETWDRVPHRAPCMEPASPSACDRSSCSVSLYDISYPFFPFLSFSFFFKDFIYLFMREREREREREAEGEPGSMQGARCGN